MERGCLSLTATSSVPTAALFRRNPSHSNSRLPLPPTFFTTTTLTNRTNGNLSVKALNPNTILSSHWNVSNYAAPSQLPRFEDLDTTNMLLRQRIIFVGDRLDDVTADFIITKLLLLDSEDPTKDIRMFINSPGGSTSAGMGIYDAMRICRADISTINMGFAGSMGAFLLAAGTKGKRFCMPNARVMLHQPVGGIGGSSDIECIIRTRELSYQRIRLHKILSRITGKTEAQIDEDTDRYFFLSSWEAKDYGLVDAVIDDGKPGLVAPIVDASAPPLIKSWFLWKSEGSIAALTTSPNEDKMFLQQSPDSTGTDEKEEAPTTS